jgi:hypothetical protein
MLSVRPPRREYRRRDVATGGIDPLHARSHDILDPPISETVASKCYARRRVELENTLNGDRDHGRPRPASRPVAAATRAKRTAS